MVQLGILFPHSYAMPWNQTCVGSFAAPRRILIQDALPTELPWPWLNSMEKPEQQIYQDKLIRSKYFDERFL